MSCKICNFSKIDRMFVEEVNQMLLRGDRYSSIQAVWAYKNRHLKGKRYRKISKWSLSRHRNKCLKANSDPLDSRKLGEILPKENLEKRNYVQQGPYIFTAYWSKCSECHWVYDGVGFNIETGEKYDRISTMGLKKIPVFYSNRDAFYERCSRCGGKLEYYNGLKEVQTIKLSFGSRILDLLVKLSTSLR